MVQSSKVSDRRACPQNGFVLVEPANVLRGKTRGSFTKEQTTRRIGRVFVLRAALTGLHETDMGE